MFRFVGLCFGMLVRFFRGRRSLLLENLALRQQLVALKRRHPRVVRKNSIQLPSDGDVGTYLFGFAAKNPEKPASLGRKHFSAGLTMCDPNSPCLDSFRTQSAHWILC